VQSAVDATVRRFGRIDVVVNNAGNFKAGFFEEITPDDFRAQIETVLFGSVNVVRAALPVLRSQRAGLLVQISSTAGVVGAEFTSAYAAAKFGVEGWFNHLRRRSHPSGSAPCSSSPAFSAPNF
jgi:NAD(P)-dependent dehydrogenase (short-subunit alcohol dehydrogenase family)